MCPTYSSNPPSSLISYTTIYYDDTAMTQLKKICDLPCAYRVYDVKFVTLHRNDATQTPVKLCVFCGTHTKDVGYYSSLQWISVIDSDAFVGMFYVDYINQNIGPDTVFIRNIEDLRGAHKMVAYTETNGPFQNDCPNTFGESPILDIIGVPKANVSANTALARVKFHPECNGEIRWQTNIWTTNTGSTEKLVDIITEGSAIVTASVFNNDNQKILLRRNNQNAPISNNAYILYSFDITSSSVTPNNPHLTTHSQPIRLSPMGTNNSVLTFNAKNIDNGYTNFDGLFSFRFNIQNQSVFDGLYIKDAGDLKDVCDQSNYTSTVMLTSTGTLTSKIYTAKWNNPSYPLYTLDCSNRMLSLSKCNIGGFNNFRGFVACGTYLSTGFNFYTKLGYHRYFTSAISPDCMTSDVDSATQASITMSPLQNMAFPFYCTYEHDPTLYPVTAIAIVNTTENSTYICIY